MGGGMADITLPPMMSHPECHTYVWTEQEKAAIRARDLEVAKCVLEAAAKLKADAMEIFNSNHAMTPQETRDVIEWYSASLSAMEIKHD